MGKSVLPAGYVNVSFRLSAAIVAELDALAEQAPGASVLYPLNRSDILREAVHRYIRARRRADA